MGQLKQVFEIKRETRRDSRHKIKRLAKIRPKVTCNQIEILSRQELKRKLDSLNSFSTKKRTGFPTTPGIKALSEWVTNNSIQPDTPSTIDSEFDLFIGCSGGPPSRTFLRALRLKKHYRLTVSRILQNLPGKYDSIHIRNTDIQTDYASFFNTLIEKVKPESQLVICSDDPAMQAEACTFFGTKRVYKKNQLINEFLPFLNAPTKPIASQRSHDPDLYISDLDKKIFVVRAVADLFCLAEADSLYFCKTAQSSCGNDQKRMTSGYSLLAEILKKDPTLLCREEMRLSAN
tara:strand:- start:1053 stop:1922 length:870 start_codon:yes stop_codon:yes gene_type:complete